MKIIGLKIFSLLIITIILLSILSVDSRKRKKSRNNKNKNIIKHRRNTEKTTETSTENLNSKANSKNLNFLLNKANNKVNQRALDINNDPFLKELSNQTYENTANTQHKFHLIDMIIGKVVQILGIKNEIILDILKTNKLDEATRIKIFNGILKFQKSNNIDDLKFLYTDLKVFELTETNFNPSKVFDLRLFLNTHVRN
jgi:hypothetical protein